MTDRDERIVFYRKALRDLEEGLYVLFGRDDHFHTFVQHTLTDDEVERFDAYGDACIKKLREHVEKMEAAS